MKKLKYLLMLLVLMIVVPSDVFGDNRDDRSDNNHIVSVEKIFVDGADVTVEGYAFISHQDNYGLLGDVNGDNLLDGNIKSYIVAYNDYTPGPLNENWFDSHLNINVGTNNETTNISCKSLDNCYVVDTTVVERDMWFSRCVESCAKEQEILNARRNSLLNSSACRGGATDCIYYNVGFAATIELDVIISSFLGDRNGETRLFESIQEYNRGIGFVVVTINTEVLRHRTSDRDYEVGVRTSYLAANPYICDYRDANGNNVDCLTGGEEMTSGLYSFSISDLPNLVLMDAREAIPKWNCDGTESVNSEKVCLRMEGDWASPTRVFAEQSFETREKNLVYRVAGWMKKTIIKPVDGMDAALTTYVDGLYKLEGYECTDSGDSELPNKICPVYTGFDKTSRDWNYYWSDANWVVSSGNFVVRAFKLNIESIECTNINRGRTNDVNNVSKSTSCDTNPAANASFYSCDKLSSVESTIYFKEGSTRQCSSQYVEVAGNYYIPITVRAEILVEQEGNFHFADFTPNVVKAGKGFNISDVSNGISYNNTLRFIVANKYSSASGAILKGTPYISYSGERLIYNSSTGRCEVDPNFNLTKKITDNYSESNVGGVFYYKDGNNMVTANALNVMIAAINNSFISSHASNYNSKIDSTDKEISDMFKFESCNSNSSGIFCDDIIDVDGLWNSTYSNYSWVRVDASNTVYQSYDDKSPNDGKVYRGFGMEYTSNHIYNLPYAYVALADMNYDEKNYKYADIVYTSSLVSNPLNAKLQYVGNKYFVGFKYVYDNPDVDGFDFPFNLARSDISFVSDMHWYLNGTCGVDVTNGYYEYKCDDPSDCTPGTSEGKTSLLYKYRSISVNNAFPKFSDSNYLNAAVNWKNWYWNSDLTVRQRNRNRLVKTYDDSNLDYSITFSKSDISNIINCNRNGKCSNGYGSMANFSVDGSPQMSNFVKEFFQKTPTSNKYCGLGLFSPSCDGYTEAIHGGFVPIIPNNVGDDILVQGDSGTNSSYDEEVIS